MSATMKPEHRNYAEPEISMTPAQRLAEAARLRPFKAKDVEVPGLGRFKVRELKQREIEEVNAPLYKQNTDGKGNVTSTIDQRSYHARAIAAALVNDDMSQVYPNMAEGVAIINELPKDAAAVLWDAVDELNVLSAKAKEELGKASGGTEKKNTGGDS